MCDQRKGSRSSVATRREPFTSVSRETFEILLYENDSTKRLSDTHTSPFSENFPKKKKRILISSSFTLAFDTAATCVFSIKIESILILLTINS